MLQKGSSKAATTCGTRIVDILMLQHVFPVIGLEMLGSGARVAGFIEACIGKSDREATRRTVRDFAQKPRHRRGVEAAAEEGAEVGTPFAGDRTGKAIPKHLHQGVAQFGLRDRPRLGIGRRPIEFGCNLPTLLEANALTWHELANLAIDSAGAPADSRK